MAIYQKIEDAWETVDRPYVKRGNAWVPVVEAYVKRSGTWVRAYEYDVTPPPAPSITVQNVQTKYGTNNSKDGNHISIGVQIPGVHNPEIRLIRLLTTYAGKQPSTPTGGTYVSSPDDNWPDEAWSNFEYGGNKHTDVIRYKTWPRSAKTQTVLAPGRYYFSAWSRDDAGLWSQGVHTHIDVPKPGANAPKVIQKEAKFLPTFAGSYKGGVFIDGEMRAQGSPKSRGMLSYGNQVNSVIGEQGEPTIQYAQIYLSRATDDGGVASAKVYIGWHNQAFVGNMPTDLTASEQFYLGRLSKGEGKWFNIPEAHFNNLDTSFKGFFFVEKHPDAASAQTEDFSVLRSLEDSPNQGTLAVVWTEAL